MSSRGNLKIRQDILIECLSMIAARLLSMDPGADGEAGFLREFLAQICAREKGPVIWAKFGLLRCYYLGQVCLYKTLFVKNTVKIGVSALFLFWKNCAREFEVLLSGPAFWAKLAIFKLQSTWPR